MVGLARPRFMRSPIQAAKHGSNTPPDCFSDDSGMEDDDDSGAEMEVDSSPPDALSVAPNAAVDVPFLLSVTPKARTVRALVHRWKSGLITLHLRDDAAHLGEGRFLAAALRRSARSGSYSLATSRTDFSPASQHSLGKLKRVERLGGGFTLFGPAPAGSSSGRRERGVALARVGFGEAPKAGQPLHQVTLHLGLELLEDAARPVEELRGVEPVVGDSGSLELDFDGRRVLSSTKNFMLARGGHGPPLLFFAKTLSKGGNDWYLLDFQEPCTPLQAFGVALTAFSEGQRRLAHVFRP